MKWYSTGRLKYLVAFVTILLTVLPIYADKYDQLWKNVEESSSKDLPQTTMKEVDRIISLARRQKNGGHLMKAILVKYQLHQDISQDSALAYIPVIEKELSAEKSPAMQALFHVALGALYGTLPDEEGRQIKQKSISHYMQSVSQPEELFQAKAPDYVPLIIVGEDSRYYNNDLLSIVALYSGRALKNANDEENATDSIAQRIFHETICRYHRARMHEAEFFVRCDSADLFVPENQKEKFYQQLIDRFSETDVCGEAYLRLAQYQPDTAAYQTLVKAAEQYPKCKLIGQIQSRINHLRRPELRVELSNSQMRPLAKGKISVKGRNVAVCRLVFYKTNYTAQSPDVLNFEPSNDKIHLGEVAKTMSISLPQGATAQWTEAEVDYSLSEPGIYIVSLEGLGQSKDRELLYVTNVHIMDIPLPDKKVRVVVSDAGSGKPISEAEVVMRSTDKERTLYKTLKTDANGELLIDYADLGQKTVFPVVRGDKYCPGVYINKMYYPSSNYDDSHTMLSLYTDRAIYRPGQTVYVGGFMYAKQNDDLHVMAGQNVRLKLLDANHKEIATETLLTDEFGALKASFVLPEHCLNGTFLLEAGIWGSVHFKVEEYKRPTFSVKIDDIKTSYAAGDTVTLNGTVKTYAGFPLVNTPVSYIVKRSEAFWYNFRGMGKELMAQDTVYTDEKGEFRIPVILGIDVDSNPRFYQFSTEVRVTAENGETENASYSIHVGNRPATMYTTLPERVCKERIPTFVIAERNMQGESIQGKAHVNFYREGHLVQTAEWNMNTPLPPAVFRNLPSGTYRMVAVPSDRNDSLVVLKHHFFLFSLKDQKVDKEPLLVYATGDTFSEPVSVFVGTSLKDVYLHYDCFAENKLVESRLIRMNDNAILLKYNYKEDYGNGLRLVFTYVKDNRVYSERVTIRKPDPDKQLKLQWKSFRDRLHPGQQETWILQVLKGNKPVAASLLATLYDAALDKLCKNDWSFGLYFNRNINIYNWSYRFGGSLGLNAIETVKEKIRSQYWQFSSFDMGILSPVARMESVMLASNATGVSSVRMLKRMAAKPMMSAMADVAVQSAEAKVYKNVTTDGSMQEEQEEAGNLRTDFGETAFFCSGLTTDDKGEAQLAFQLPQSLTQWNFRALAHDEEMNYGRLDTMIVASKEFMVQANMPRFLRVGDKATIVASIRNASDQIQRGIVSFDILDPSTMKVVNHEDRNFEVSVQGEENVVFDIAPTTQYPLLICRFVAKGKSFSDGEQYYLPVLEDLQEVTETYPLTLGQNGERVVNIPDTSAFRRTSSSYRKLIVEYTANPIWTAIEALPSVANSMSYSATSLANMFYVTTMAAMEAQRHPEILSLADRRRAAGSVDSIYLQLERNQELKQIVLNETPWVAAADAERSRLENLAQLFDTLTLSYKRQGCLDRLLDLQSPGGGWSWYKGMPDNLWVTINVAEILVRLNASASQWMPEKGWQALLHSMNYMDAEVKRWIDELKTSEKKNKTRVTVPHTLLRYIYICALMNHRSHSNVTFLLDRLENSAPRYDMYEKAMAARVLGSYSRKSAAMTTLQSLMEHTVYTPEAGRYFDTRRAPSFYESYRIPTHVATMEALESMNVNATQLKEMQQWLLHSKRTQAWNNPVSAVDAIYYLFSMDRNGLNIRMQMPQISVISPDGSRKPVVQASDVKEAETLGYVYKSVPLSGQIPSAIVFSKGDEQMSFASVYAQYTVPVSEVQDMQSGLSLQCTCEVQRGVSWQVVTEATSLRKGDVLRVRYDISAQRDYDFVSLKAGKAACLEPVNALSGYSWRDGCYREADDVSMQYFFQQLPKGKHVLYETFNVDRAGTYHTSAPVIQCAYSPEFSARAVAQSISVK